jgi:ADP-heptose:LPS heptosyltransferase
MKVLVVRFSSIGDVVLTTPVVRALKEQRPDCEIHYITKKPFKSLLEHNPHISKVYTFQKSVKEILPELKGERYDQIIDLHHNLRSVLLSLYLGVKASRFRKLNVRKWLLVNLKWKVMPELHVVDRYFRAVASLGVKNDQKNGELFLRPEDHVDVNQNLGVDVSGYLAIAIGAQFATKRMPSELLVKALSKIDTPVVLCGGESDTELALAIVNALPEKVIVNACGNFTLLQSASIVSQSAAILTNDTGLMHIASCFQIPTVSVWGNTVPELGMYPYFPQDKSRYSLHQAEGISCRPCSKIGFQECPKGHFNCMQQQNAEEIVRETNKFLHLAKK